MTMFEKMDYIEIEPAPGCRELHWPQLKTPNRDWDMVIISHYFSILASICWEFDTQKYVQLDYQSDRNIKTCSYTVWF